MEILTEAAQALFIVGVPIGLFTLAMVWWGLHRGHTQTADDLKTLGLEIESAIKSSDPEQKKPTARKTSSDYIHKKWMSFGGGFYGIVALFTWLVIEFNEIAEMVQRFGGVVKFFQSINIGIIVNVFIEGFMNFITAIIWPIYWTKQISTEQTWLWFIAAFVGYSLGSKLAHKAHQAQAEKSA